MKIIAIIIEVAFFLIVQMKSSSILAFALLRIVKHNLEIPTPEQPTICCGNLVRFFSLLIDVDYLSTSAIIVHFSLRNTKRGLTLKIHAFLICVDIRDIGVMVDSVKPVITPIKPIVYTDTWIIQRNMLKIIL